MNKASQSAVEYLATYGWMVLILVVALAILFSFGFFGSGVTPPQTISGFSGLKVTAAAANSTLFEFLVSNSLGITVNTTNISVSLNGNKYINFLCTALSLAPGQSSVCIVPGSFTNSFSNFLVYINYTAASYGEITALSSGQVSLTPTSVSLTYSFTPTFMNITLLSPSVTPNNFQQMISFNPQLFSSFESQNLGNIRFFNRTKELYSWCESGCSVFANNSVFWVNLSGSLPANKPVNITLVFEKPTTYDGVYAGEAPQLSPIYGEYDNGAKVFNFYDNFIGTTLKSSLWTSSGAVTVNNGLSISNSTTDSYINSTHKYSIASNALEVFWNAVLTSNNSIIFGLTNASGIPKINAVFWRSGAKTQNATTITSPANAVYYQRLSITNNAKISTSNHWVVLINMTINASNKAHINNTAQYSFQNVEFLVGIGGNTIPSWLENYSFSKGWAMYFINISKLSASATNSSIYIAYASNITNFFSINQGVVGENPVLSMAPGSSTNYGKYDSGAKVFSIYFNGSVYNACSSCFSLGTGSTLTTSTVNYGGKTIKVLNDTAENLNASFVYNKGIPAGAYIAVSDTEDTSISSMILAAVGLLNSSSASSIIRGSKGFGIGGGEGAALVVNLGVESSYLTVGGGSLASNTWYYTRLYLNGTSATNYFKILFSNSTVGANYSNFNSESALNVLTLPSFTFYYGLVTGLSGSASSKLYTNWVMVYPAYPNGVNPMVKQGSLSGGTVSTIVSGLDFSGKYIFGEYSSGAKVNVSVASSGAKTTANLDSTALDVYTGPNYIELENNINGFTNKTLSVYWVRIRSLPVGNVMPSVTFGPIS
jgi:hypothetical protein